MTLADGWFLGLSLRQIPYPSALVHHPGAQNALEHIRSLADGVQRNNAHIGETAQAEGDGYAEAADEAIKEALDKAELETPMPSPA